MKIVLNYLLKYLISIHQLNSLTVRQEVFMTVGELIRKLSQYREDLPVVVEYIQHRNYKLITSTQLANDYHREVTRDELMVVLNVTADLEW